MWLWSRVELTPEIKNEICVLGPVQHLVSPDKLHHLSLGAWQAAFPKRGCAETAATISKYNDLFFSGTLADEASIPGNRVPLSSPTCRKPSARHSSPVIGRCGCG